MRRGWTAVVLMALGCGGAAPAPAPPPPPPPPRTVALPTAASRGRVMVMSGTSEQFDGYRFLAFSKSGVVIASSALGVHRIDARAGSDRVLIPYGRGREQRELLAAGGSAVARWMERGPGEPTVEHLDLIDVESGALRSLPAADTQRVALSTDGTRLVWESSREARALLYDTKTGAVLQTFAVPSLTNYDEPRLAPSGRFLFVHGGLFDVQSAREIWRAPVGGEYWKRGIDFVQVGGEEYFVYPAPKLLRLVAAATGAVTTADVDCLHGAMPSGESVVRSAGAFVRSCARGELYTDLVALAAATGPKPLAPVRVRDGRELRVMPDGTLRFRTSPSPSRYSSLAAPGSTDWVAYDPRVGKPTKVAAPDEAPESQGGGYVVARTRGRACEIRAKDAAPQPHEESASEKASFWLCSAKLSADGTLFAQYDDGTLTIGEVPSLRTLYAVGDSRRRLDESAQMALVVEDERLRVKGRGYRGSDATENEFDLARSASVRPYRFTPVSGDKDLATLTPDQGSRIRFQVDPAERDSCVLVGVLREPDAKLVRCGNGARETYYRFDATSLALTSSRRSGRGWTDVPLSVTLPDGERAYPNGYGSVGDVVVQPGDYARGLPITELRHAQSHEILAHLHVGWDFVIADDSAGHVQIFGNRKRAATWLRCLDTDGTLRPFDACAKAAEATLY